MKPFFPKNNRKTLGSATEMNFTTRYTILNQCMKHPK